MLVVRMFFRFLFYFGSGSFGGLGGERMVALIGFDKGFCFCSLF